MNGATGPSRVKEEATPHKAFQARNPHAITIGLTLQCRGDTNISARNYTLHCHDLAISSAESQKELHDTGQTNTPQVLTQGAFGLRAMHGTFKRGRYLRLSVSMESCQKKVLTLQRDCPCTAHARPASRPRPRAGQTKAPPYIRAAKLAHLRRCHSRHWQLPV